MTSVAVVLVTHNSSRWMQLTAQSIVDQMRPANRIVVVDDGSTDDTIVIARDILGGALQVLSAEPESTSRISRIASNFQQGVRACRDTDVVVLGDHDDVWHADRIAHQVTLLEANPAITMIASDGRLVDDEGRSIGGTLRSIFPVSQDFNELSPGDQMRTTLRYSVATGGASAVRPASFADLDIPPGWLHDRWWSLVATARETMFVDPAVVIDYRVTAEQEVGLDRGTQASSGAARVTRAAATDGAGALRKLRDVQTRLLPMSTEATRIELRTSRLVRNLLQRA
jgi:glycosyltransferase involved in cell wall biosynthesis